MLDVSLPRVPEGLRDFMKNFTKEVLKQKPPNIYEFSEQYFESLIKVERDFEFGKFEPVSSYEALFRKGTGQIHTQTSFSLICTIIPEELTQLIKEFIKAVLRTNPHNICKFGAQYFRNLKEIHYPFSLEYDSYEKYLKNNPRFLTNSYAKCTCGRILAEELTESVGEKKIFEQCNASQRENHLEILNSPQAEHEKQSKFGQTISESCAKVDYNSRQVPEQKIINAVLTIQRLFRRAIKKRNSVREKKSLHQKYAQVSEEKAAFIIQRTLRKLINKSTNPENQPNKQIIAALEIEHSDANNQKDKDIRNFSGITACNLSPTINISPESVHQLPVVTDGCINELNQEAIGIKYDESKIVDIPTYKDIYSSSEADKETSSEIKLSTKRGQATMGNEKEIEMECSTKNNKTTIDSMIFSTETSSAADGKIDASTFENNITSHNHEEKSKSVGPLVQEKDLTVGLINDNENSDEVLETCITDDNRKALNPVDNSFNKPYHTKTEELNVSKLVNSLNGSKNEIDTNLTIMSHIMEPELIQSNITLSNKEIHQEGITLIPLLHIEVDCLPQSLKKNELDQPTASPKTADQKGNLISVFDISKSQSLEVISEDILEETPSIFGSTTYSKEIISLNSEKVSGIDKNNIFKGNGEIRSFTGTEINEVVSEVTHENMPRNFDSIPHSAELVNKKQLLSEKSQSKMSYNSEFSSNSTEEVISEGNIANLSESTENSRKHIRIAADTTPEVVNIESNLSTQHKPTANSNDSISTSPDETVVLKINRDISSLPDCYIREASCDENANKIADNCKCAPHSKEIISIPPEKVTDVATKEILIFKTSLENRVEISEEAQDNISNCGQYNIPPLYEIISIDSDKVSKSLNNEKLILRSNENKPVNYESIVQSNGNIFTSPNKISEIIIDETPTINISSSEWELMSGETHDKMVDNCKSTLQSDEYISIGSDKSLICTANSVISNLPNLNNREVGSHSNEIISLLPDKIYEISDNKDLVNATVKDVRSLSNLKMKEEIHEENHNNISSSKKPQDEMADYYDYKSQSNEMTSSVPEERLILETNEVISNLSNLGIREVNSGETQIKISDNCKSPPYATEIMSIPFDNLSESVSNEAIEDVRNPSSLETKDELPKEIQAKMAENITSHSAEAIYILPEKVSETVNNENVILKADEDPVNFFRSLKTQDKMRGNGDSKDGSNETISIGSDERLPFKANEDKIILSSLENKEAVSEEKLDITADNFETKLDSCEIFHTPPEKVCEPVNNEKFILIENEDITNLYTCQTKELVFGATKNEMKNNFKSTSHTNEITSTIPDMVSMDVNGSQCIIKKKEDSSKNTSLDIKEASSREPQDEMTNNCKSTTRTKEIFSKPPYKVSECIVNEYVGVKSNEDLINLSSFEVKKNCSTDIHEAVPIILKTNDSIRSLSSSECKEISTKEIQYKMTDYCKSAVQLNDNIYRSLDERLTLRPNGCIRNLSSPDIEEVHSGKIISVRPDKVFETVNTEHIIFGSNNDSSCESKEGSSEETQDRMDNNDQYRSDSNILTSIPSDKACMTVNNKKFILKVNDEKGIHSEELRDKIADNDESTEQSNETTSISVAPVLLRACEAPKNLELILKSNEDFTNLPILDAREVSPQEALDEIAYNFKSSADLNETVYGTSEKGSNMAETKSESDKNKTNETIAINLMGRCVGNDKSEWDETHKVLLGNQNSEVLRNVKHDEIMQNTGNKEIGTSLKLNTSQINELQSLNLNFIKDEYQISANVKNLNKNETFFELNGETNAVSDQNDDHLKLFTENSTLHKSVVAVKEPANYEIIDLDVIRHNFVSKGEETNKTEIDEVPAINEYISSNEDKTEIDEVPAINEYISSNEDKTEIDEVPAINEYISSNEDKTEIDEVPAINEYISSNEAYAYFTSSNSIGSQNSNCHCISVTSKQNFKLIADLKNTNRSDIEDGKVKDHYIGRSFAETHLKSFKSENEIPWYGNVTSNEAELNDTINNNGIEYTPTKSIQHLSHILITDEKYIGGECNDTDVSDSSNNSTFEMDSLEISSSKDTDIEEDYLEVGSALLKHSADERMPTYLYGVHIPEKNLVSTTRYLKKSTAFIIPFATNKDFIKKNISNNKEKKLLIESDARTEIPVGKYFVGNSEPPIDIEIPTKLFKDINQIEDLNGIGSEDIELADITAEEINLQKQIPSLQEIIRLYMLENGYLTALFALKSHEVNQTLPLKSKSAIHKK